MKTAEEVAGELADEIRLKLNSTRSYAGLSKILTKALTAYAEERVKELAETFNRREADMRGRCYSKVAEQDLKKARAEAFEEAAIRIEFRSPELAEAIRVLKTVVK